MYLKIILFSLLTVVIQHFATLIYLFGFQGTVYNHAPGPCQYVSGVENGAEDMQTLPNGLTFISSGYRFPHHTPEDPPDGSGQWGRILLYDFNAGQRADELKLEGFDTRWFVPHGIGVWQDKLSGDITVFIVNHHKQGDRIESFIYQPEKRSLKHLSTFMDPLMKNVNDVLPTGPETFYFTNWLNSKSELAKYLEVFLLLPWANIAYYDGHFYKVVSDGLMMANGLAMSLDGKYIYVICTMTKDVKIFERESNGSLTFYQEFTLDTLPDNLTVEPETGNIWIGAHPRLLQCIHHMNNKVISAPSQVLMLEVKNGNVYSMREVYSNDGSSLVASTVASFYKNQLLIGTLQEKLLYCEGGYIFNSRRKFSRKCRKYNKAKGKQKKIL